MQTCRSYKIEIKEDTRNPNKYKLLEYCEYENKKIPSQCAQCKMFKKRRGGIKYVFNNRDVFYSKDKINAE